VTKTELIALRDATYREPPEKRCGTCGHCNLSAYRAGQGSCRAIMWRDKIMAAKDVNLGGVCDLWEPRKEST
jgi:hypothetical protein